jgi:hypothetical protein
MNKLHSLLTLLAFLVVGTGLFVLFNPLNQQATGQNNSCPVVGWAWGGGGPNQAACSLSVNPPSIIPGQSSTLVWNSPNAFFTTLEPGNIILDPPSSGSMSVNPISTTLYTATFVSTGGEAVCEAELEVIVEYLGPPRNLTCTPIPPGQESFWRMALDWDPPAEIPSYGFDYYILFRYPEFHTLQCWDYAGNPVACPVIIENVWGTFEVDGPPDYLPHSAIDPFEIEDGVGYYYSMIAVSIEDADPNDNEFFILNVSPYSNTAACTPNGQPPGDYPPWGGGEGDPCNDDLDCGSGSCVGGFCDSGGGGDGGGGPGVGPGEGKPICDIELLCCATCEDYGFGGGGGDIVVFPGGCTCTPNNSPIGGVVINCPGSVPYFACDPCLSLDCPK